MTIEELLEWPARDIATMSNEQLTMHLRKYFPYTRPANTLDSALSVAVDKRTANEPRNEAIDQLERKIQEEYEKRKAESAARKAVTIAIKTKPAIPPARQ